MLELTSGRTFDATAPVGGPHLAHGLDTELPEQLVAGHGVMLPLRGWCYSVDGPLQALEVIAGGQATALPNHSWGRTDIFIEHCPARDPSGNSLLSGFEGFVPFPAVATDTDVPLSLRATLEGGGVAEQPLGTIRVLSGYGAEPVRVTWPSTGPRVAICMATFRPPIDLLMAQIASIRAQTHTNWVCIISDDNTENEDFDRFRLRLKGDERFVVFHNKERLNFYANFQHALSLTPADAEFVALCDQDDVWRPDKLETLLAAFTGTTQLVYSNARVVRRDGTVLSDTFWNNRQNNYTDLSTLMMANTITGAASMVRASLLPDVLPFPVQVGPAFHDHWIGLVALVRGGLGYIDRPLYDYVQHGSGVIGHKYLRWPGAGTALLNVLRAGPKRSEMALAASLALKHALDEHPLVLQKVGLARTLLLRNPDISARHRAVLQRFARLETSVRSGLAEKFQAVRARRPTLNLESLLLWSMLGARLRNFGLKRKQRSLTRRQTQAPGQRLLGAVIDMKAARPETQAPDRPLTEAEKPHPWWPALIPALMFGQTRWVHRNISGFPLDMSEAHPKRVNLIMATINFSYVFGGYIGMFSLALRLCREGYRVRIILHEDTEWDMEEWREKIRRYPGVTTLFDEVEVISRWDRTIPVEVSPDDRFIATNCWAAHIAHNTAKAFPETRFIMMAQEYEPFFLPMNSINALFQQAYALPQLTLFSTELLRDYFREERIGIYARPDGDRDALVFSNAIQVFHPTEEQIARTEKRLLFYARPEDHAARNLFEMGMMAISALVHDPRVDLTGWTFHGVGSLGGNTLELRPGVTFELVAKTSLEEYIRMMPSFDVGLSLMMTPHPSLVPIEMASAGMWTVTNTFANKTAERLRAISTNLIGVPPTIEGICDGLVEAMGRVDRLDDRLAGARVNWPTSWDDAFPPATIAAIRGFLGDP